MLTPMSRRWSVRRLSLRQVTTTGGDEDAADGDADNYGKRLEVQIKSLRAEHKDALKRLTSLTKTTPTGKPSKGSIAWIQAQGMDTEAVQRELEDLQRELDPVKARRGTLEKEVAPYKADQEAG